MNALRDLQVFYGGTFDPVHHGHLAIACAARDALCADPDGDCLVDIRLTPAADPPHRARPGASPMDRAQMVRLAIDTAAGLSLDCRELERGGQSWTIDTLHHIREEFGANASIAWLVGADGFLDLPAWKRWRELFALTHFVVAERPGNSLGRPRPELVEMLTARQIEDPQALRRSPAGLVFRLHQPLQPHSASDLRRRIVAGARWRPLVPDAVADYIVEHRLYGYCGATCLPER